MLLAGVGLRKFQLLCLSLALSGSRLNDQMSVGNRQRVLHGIRQTGFNSFPKHQSVHDDLNIVFFVFLQRNGFGKVIQIAVHANTDVPPFFGIGKHFFVHTLLPSHNGSQDHEPRSFFHHQDPINDLVGGLLTDLLAAHGTVRNSDTSIQQTKIIVNFRHGSHRGTGIFGCGLLVDGDGGRKSVDGINVGLIQLSQKHTGVGRQRLHESTVSLGINGIKRQRGLSRSR